MDIFHFWEQEFGDAREGRDYAGRKVLRPYFGRYDHRYGWVIERICRHGAEIGSNMHVVNVTTELIRRGREAYEYGGGSFRVARGDLHSRYDYSRKDFAMLAQGATGIWQREFGTSDVGIDFTGAILRREEFGTDSPEAWNVDHIRPLARGGKDVPENRQITSVAVNSAKADLTSFILDGIRYEVVRCTETDDGAFYSTPYDYTYKDFCVVKL